MLSGMMVPGHKWHDLLWRYRRFRSAIRTDYGVPVYAEIHGKDLVGSRGRVGGQSMKLKKRRSLLARCINLVSGCDDLGIGVFSVVLHKDDPGFRDKPEGVHGYAAKTLYQRFSNRLKYLNKDVDKAMDTLGSAAIGLSEADKEAIRCVLRAMPRHHRGVIFADETNAAVMTKVLRKMRVYNPIPNVPEFGNGWRNQPDQWIVEDPSYKDSANSAFIQLVDWVATALKCQEDPTAYNQKHGMDGLYESLRPVLFTRASRQDPRKQGTYRYPRQNAFPEK